MATAEKRVVTDATGQAMLAELRKIPGVMNPVPVEKGGTGVTTPEGIRELINAQEKFDFNVEEELNKRAKSVNGILPDELGNIQVLHVAEADNFSSDEAQTISGTFVERTTGGDASIHDGTANLTALYGYSVRSGYSEETKSFQVIPTGRLDDSEPISAEINWSTYKTAVNNVSTNKTFTYGVSGWNENPETYGVTVSGTPATGDVMNVYFTAEVRGTIANTTPQTFVETGWNLYNHTNGYARVLKYSEDYGFKIGGTYTSIAFAETVEGAQIVLTPDSSGVFTVPSDGYVFVTGGNDTDTFILMTWSDWGEGYTGDFETYSESVVDLSELMSNAFPYGMCNIGIVYDEINFNDKTAYVRIERQAYTAENLINAEATGRAFTYDANYIYIVKETPEKIRFNISSEVTVYDHGTEYFTGTDLPVLTYQLFGQNLKDKLRREVVTVTPQNFSVSQKAIARQNIDAAFDQEVIKTINHKTPDQYGDITIVEGTANASYGLYRINATIQPAAWSLVNGAYQIAYADPLIKSDMDGMETWLDNPEAMKGKTRFTTIDGALIISTAVQPTETWGLHVALGTNGATVLEQVANKAEENTVALVEHDDTAFHTIAAGQYVLWKGALYKATAAITAGATLASSGNNKNLSALSKGVSNDLDGRINNITNTYANMGSTSSPISDLDDLPVGGNGYCVLSASLSPTGAVSSWSYVKSSTTSNTRYRVFITLVSGSSSAEKVTYVGTVYDHTFQGWRKITFADEVVRINTNSAMSGIATSDTSNQWGINLQNKATQIEYFLSAKESGTVNFLKKEPNGSWASIYSLAKQSWLADGNFRFYSNVSNLKEFSFTDLPRLTNNSYKYFLLAFGDPTGGGDYGVLIGGITTNNAAVSMKFIIGNNTTYPVTAVVENDTLKFTFTNTRYGGVRLFWLG